MLKTPAAKRDIPIPKCLVDCLREAKENSISDYVIADSKGEPLAASQFQRVWQYVVVHSTKPRNYYKYVNGESIKSVSYTHLMVLANTVQLQDWDGRYSRRNKEWAKTIPNDNPETVRCGYVLNSHPAVLDGFIDLVREEQQLSRTQGEKIQPSRPSVRDKLKQELPAHKPAAPKKQGPER